MQTFGGAPCVSFQTPAECCPDQWVKSGFQLGLELCDSHGLLCGSVSSASSGNILGFW